MNQASVKRLVSCIQRLRSDGDRSIRLRCLQLYMMCLQSSSLSWRMFAADELVAMGAHLQPQVSQVRRGAQLVCTGVIFVDLCRVHHWLSRNRVHHVQMDRGLDRGLVTSEELLTWMESDDVKLFDYLIGDKLHQELLKRCTPLLLALAESGKIDVDRLKTVGCASPRVVDVHRVSCVEVVVMRQLVLVLPLPTDVSAHRRCP